MRTLGTLALTAWLGVAVACDDDDLPPGDAGANDGGAADARRAVDAPGTADAAGSDVADAGFASRLSFKVGGQPQSVTSAARSEATVVNGNLSFVAYTGVATANLTGRVTGMGLGTRSCGDAATLLTWNHPSGRAYGVNRNNAGATIAPGVTASCTITITKVGALGEAVEGTFSAVLPRVGVADAAGEHVVITEGSFSVELKPGT